MEVQRKRTKSKKKKAKPLDGTGYVNVEIAKKDKSDEAPVVTSRDAIDDLLPKLPEVGSASVTTSEERLDNVRQEESTEDHGLVDESCTETLNVELSAVTSLVNEDVELLLPSVAEMTVPRIEEDVSEQFHLQAEDIWQPETSVQRIEEDVSEQFHLQAEDIWQPETSVQTGDLHDIAIKVEKQQQQQQTQQQQQQQQLQEQQEQQQQQQQQLEQHIEKPTEEIAPTLEVSESVEVVPKPLVMSTVTELPAMPVYPRLDSLIAVGTAGLEDTVPYNEDELAALYPNPQLDANEQFIDYFIKASQQDHHELYKLLMTHLKERQALVVLQCKIEDLKGSYERNRDCLWRVQSKTVTSQGKCLDNSDVSHQHTYNVAVFNKDSLNEVKSTLKSLRKLLEEELCLKLYSSQLSRIHIEYYLYKICYAIPSVSTMTPDTPVACITDSSFTPPDIVKLRDCISVLFMFERRPVEDKQFKTDCRQWLDMLLSVLLRVASLQDHQFILNHLLRCPPGVASWGTRYIQLITPQALADPTPMFIGAYDVQEGMGQGLHRDWASPLLDHFVTMLATLTMPIRQRDEFLSMMGVAKNSGNETQPAVASAPWTFIGEDLEEEEEGVNQLLLKEIDFMEFFDQFPFNDVFQHILHISANEEYRPECTSSYSMMKLIAFCTCLIRLLGTAFSTLKLQRYKEFNKRIGRCIRLIVQYVADHWLAYRSYQLQQLGVQMNQFPDTIIANEPRYTLNRLQLEMDCFMFRATKWILIGHKQGAWQFMADMPYGVVSIPMMWHILLVLYTNVSASIPDQVCDMEDTKRKLQEVAIREQFVDRMMRNLTSETVFLLTTFVNMATSCGSGTAEEIEFINTVTLEIFECTQLVEFARDAYADNGSSLLGSIAVVHPFIISSLMHKTRDNIGAAGENCLLVFKNLPLHLWTPTMEDMEILREWLINFSLKSHENALAMLTLEHMNWGMKNEAELALDYSLHKMVALLLVEAHARHLPTHPGGVDFSSGLNPETSLSKFMSIGSGLKEEQAKFSRWSWEVSLMLKLHPMQQPSPILQPIGVPLTIPPEAPRPAKLFQPSASAAPSNVNAMLSNLPSLAHQELLEIHNAVERKGLLASYLAFCLSNIGLDTDAFLEAGLPLLRQLVEQGYILPATRILANITPRFFGQEKVLVKNEKFMQVLFSITNADYQNASSVEKVTKLPPPVYMRNLLALIQTQIHRASAPGHSISDTVLKFWLTLFTSYPNWFREQCLLYLLDGLSQVSFKHAKWQSIIWESLISSYVELQQTQPQKSGLLSTIMYLWGQEGELPSLFRLVSPKEFPWLAFDALSAEQLYEEKEGYWTGLLKQLKGSNKITMDAALKRTLADMRKPTGAYLCNHYCIFRWASFASELDPSHPLLPLVWQRFFMLYLQRPTLNPGNAESESYGKRLLENYGHVKKLKSSLSSASTYHQQQAECETLDESPDKEHHRNLAKVYQTFLRWLEEPLLHEGTVYLPSLPPQYDATRLSQLFQPDNVQPWLDLIPLWRIEKETLTLVSDWVKTAAYQKQKPFVSQNKVLDAETAGTRILKRLRKRVETVKPPPLALATNPLPILNDQIYTSPQLLITTLKRDITLIIQEARNFSVKTSGMLLLDEEYFNLVPRLYSNEPRQLLVNVPCRRRFNRNHQCAGPAKIVFRFEELVNVTSCQTQAEQNRADHKEIVAQLQSCISQEFCTIVVKFEHVINELVRLVNQLSNREAADAAIALFYEIARCVSVESRQFGPSSQFFTSVIEILGQEFIQRDPSQTRLILEMMITTPSLSGLLAPLFTPNLSPEQYLEMYNLTIQLAVKEGSTIAFQLLTKFNIIEWLSTDEGASKQGELLTTVFQGLTMCGCNATINGADILLEIYRRHFREILRFKFPKYYFNALKLVLQGTDRADISAACWYDVLSCIENVSSTENSGGTQTTLTLQQLQETVNWFGDHFMAQRKNNISLYSSYVNYIINLAEFSKFLIKALCTRLSSIVDVHSMSIDEAITVCWQSLLKLYEAWITTYTIPDKPNILFHPWQDYEAPCAEHFVSSFVECILVMQQSLKTSNYSNSPVSLTWIYYCEHMSIANKDYVLSVYHDKFTKLPWEEFYPDLSSVEYMIKLKLNYHQSSSFLFLGEISSQINWLSLVKLYSNTEPEADKVATLNRLHGLLLHLFILLSSESGKTSSSGDIFHTLHKAHNFYWQYLDNNYYANVVEWLKNYGECSLIVSSGSSLSASLRLLKVAAGFPSSENLPIHPDAPSKRKSYVVLLIELISKCTYLPVIEAHRYKDIMSHVLQVIVDTALADTSGKDIYEVIKMLEEVFNLLNICNHSNNVVTDFIKIIHSIYDDVPDIQIISLPSITAATRIVASIPTMVEIIEKSIESFFTTLVKPSALTAPAESSGFGWYSVTNAMVISETILAEFRSTCVEKCACLTLHAMLLQTLPSCKNYADEKQLLSTIIDWCMQIKLSSSNEYKLLLLWEKILGLLLRQARLQGSSSDLVSNFSTLAQMLVKIGEDKASEGFLGAIGLGKKSPYSFKFRLIARSLAAFIYVQMPVDSSHMTQMRLVPNSPGHIKEYSKGGITPTKQAEQAYTSLEALLSNKQYTKLREHVHSTFMFMNDSYKTLMNVMDLFIHLVASLYMEHRALDLLRIQIT